MPSHRITVSTPTPGALEGGGGGDGGGGGIGGAANAAVRRAIGQYFVIPSRTTTTAVAAATTMATPVPADVLVSDEGEDGEGGVVIIGRKRTHLAAGLTGSSDGSATATTAARDRWGERRGYV